jgi:hypothetical protein
LEPTIIAQTAPNIRQIYSISDFKKALESLFESGSAVYVKIPSQGHIYEKWFQYISRHTSYKKTLFVYRISTV